MAKQPHQDLRAPIDEIADSLRSDLGMEVSDHFPCLIRVGDDWRKYSFDWEPFRDLASSTDWPEDALPIVLISSGHKMDKPRIETFSEPHPHIRIEIAHTIPLITIVETWIAQLADIVSPASEPNDRYLKLLDLDPGNVSSRVRQFLGLEQPPEVRIVPLSVTVRAVASELGSSSITAFAIARALQTRHGEYASNRLAGATLDDVTDATSSTWEIWRDSVAELYDQDAFDESADKVLDGRLLLAGLGLLEPLLQNTLQDAGVWAPLLLEIDESMTRPTGNMREALNSVKLAHGYQNDRTGGDDELGIQGEVNALCEVIMDPDVSPPLAVGLFGIWGSGKSFFMERMRRRVHDLTTGADTRRPQNVVQIRFNAWHYADTSLWASLAIEIFERLADPEPIDDDERQEWLRGHGDPQRERREKLLASLETYREARVALERERKELEKEQQRLRGRRQLAKNARKKALSEFPLTNVVAELAANEKVKAGLAKIAAELKIQPAMDQLADVARELQTVSGSVTATWRRVTNKNQTIGLLAAAIALLALGMAGSQTGGGSWFRGLIPAAGSVASVIFAASQHLLPAAQKVSRGLKALNETLDTVGEVEAGLAAQRSKDEKLLDADLARHDEAIDEATRTIAALTDKIAAVNAEVESLIVGRRLYDFLTERATGYQKHQGVVGMLHRDFRLLDAQLRAQPAAGDASGLPRIDRVVLYIDDLDRCAPDKVLEVLEAVHLLLALELFIVVVGVDPRWLDRSLRYQYRNLCLGDDPSRDPYLRTMPTEYLEKIFQIPLTLPAMEAKAYGDLISSLAPRTALPATTATTESTADSTKRKGTTDAAGGSRTPTRALLQVQKGSAAEGRGGTPIDLTSQEVQFAQQLSGLVDTPRAAKRLMNTYRLIRATQHVGSRSRFLGADGDPGEYYAVLTLLALAAGFPRLADSVLVDLETRNENDGAPGWQAFVDELRANFKTTIADDVAETAEWQKLFDGLQASLPQNKLQNLEPYQRWGRTVARFSFTI